MLPAFALHAASVEVRELCYGSSIQRRTGLTSLEFMRDFVALNRPVIVCGAMEGHEALTAWPGGGLLSLASSLEVSVNVTPNGRADAVVGGESGQPLVWPLVSEPDHAAEPSASDSGSLAPPLVDAKLAASEGIFILPEERRMSLGSFFDLLEASRYDSSLGVPYVSHQNDSLRSGSQFGAIPGLSGALDPPKWAAEALGGEPEAVNVWIGDERSRTSMHLDHYENLYCVIAGEKEFILRPPVDAHMLPSLPRPVGRFRQDRATGAWEIVTCTSGGAERTPWIAVDPLAVGAAPSTTQLPDAPAFRCIVRPGEILYLPALWYHEVRQRREEGGLSQWPCVAANWWFDMSFGPLAAYHRLVTNLTPPSAQVH